MNTSEIRPIIYTAYSKHNYYAKMFVSAYTLNLGNIPLNPFNNWAYFMDDMVERGLVVRANNNLLMLAKEIWVFGTIADGVLTEIRLAKKLGKKIRFFSIGKHYSDILEISVEAIEFEGEVLAMESREQLIQEIKL